MFVENLFSHSICSWQILLFCCSHFLQFTTKDIFVEWNPSVARQSKHLHRTCAACDCIRNYILQSNSTVWTLRFHSNEKSGRRAWRYAEKRPKERDFDLHYKCWVADVTPMTRAIHSLTAIFIAVHILHSKQNHAQQFCSSCWIF